MQAMILAAGLGERIPKRRAERGPAAQPWAATPERGTHAHYSVLKGWQCSGQ